MMIGTGEVARRLNVSPNTIRSWVDKRYLPCTIAPSRYRLFKESDIEDFKKNKLKYIKALEGGMQDEL